MCAHRMTGATHLALLQFASLQLGFSRHHIGIALLEAVLTHVLAVSSAPLMGGRQCTVQCCNSCSLWPDPLPGAWAQD